ncbi:MAG: D-glycero-beta-D-manno-heptose-1,7-bisphosphate 7-phosphatase [Candidatus Muproteobacteria bacterium RBG_16_65_31]|uniref:D,D-heptose 1,7-bisphosphate phosphatase n=1 Tax=Candidatus Muproteobacteria bacterium RBG_16_65_31 TaxID=1817759 RepID=A0A1F6TC78_9PROT|nr:MAG: D-glycero-beta-D-manno-heptose-1,7-bisphosphate 7-phosphatase [Candidatus Muproteobacteria bacterium RBG_16_65_31]
MKLVILDRDGVINFDSDDYIKSPEEWRPIPGSLEAIAQLVRAGYKLIVATNQSGVARGLFDMETLGRIHARMLEAVRAKGGTIDAVFFCPHGPMDGCRCRKPMPGLFEEIADRLGVSLNGVYAVGDSERDVLAAQAVGARAVVVRTGKGERTLKKNKNLGQVPVFADLAAFADALLAGRLSTD